MMEIRETPIVGRLLAPGGYSFDLLELHPQRRADVPFWLQEHTFQFLGVVNGVAQPILVSRAGFAVVPALQPTTREVQYLIEDKEDVEDALRKEDDRQEELLESD